MARSHYTDEDRKRFIEKFQSELGEDAYLSRAEFARRNDLAVGTFNAWLSRAGVRLREADTSPKYGSAGTPLEVSLKEDARGSLVRFAVGTLMHRSVIDVDQLAESSSTSTRQLRNALRNGMPKSPGETDRGPDFELVRNVQRAVHATSDVFEDPAPYPVELHEELLGVVEGSSGTRIPASWLPDLCSSPPVRTTDVFARADSLFALVSSVSDESQFTLVRRRYDAEINSTIRYLYDVAVQSPRVGTRAIHLLSRLGRLALDPRTAGGVDHIRNVIYTSPLGYRAIRVMSRILTLELRGGTKNAEVLHQGAVASVNTLMTEIDTAPPDELYPDRSLFIESLWKLASTMDSGQREFLLGALSKRLTGDGGRTASPFRQAAYSAVLLERLDPGSAMALIEAEDVPSISNDDPAADFLKATLERVRDGVDEHGLALPDHECVDELRSMSATAVAGRIVYNDSMVRHVPKASRVSAALLLDCAFADLHGSRRRRALESLRHGGLGALISTVGAQLLDNAECPAWMQSQAAFCVGFSQEHRSAGMLTQHAISTPHPTVRVAALQAIGDIGLRTDTDLGYDAIVSLARVDATEWSVPERRSLAYALACTRSRFEAGSPVAESRLRLMLEDSDALVEGVSKWGLGRLRRRRQPQPESRLPSALVEA